MATATICTSPRILNDTVTRADIFNRAWSEFHGTRKARERFRAQGHDMPEKSFAACLKEAWKWFKTIAADQAQLCKAPVTKSDTLRAELMRLNCKTRQTPADRRRIGALHDQLSLAA